MVAMSGNRADLVTLGLMTLTSAFWGAAFITGKIALREFPPMTLTFLRFLIATVIIFLYLWRTEEVHVPKREDLPLLFGLGFVGIFGYYALYFTALIYTSASNAATINAMIPLVSSVLAIYVTDETLTKKKVVLILVALSGIILTVTGGDITVLTTLDFNLGDMLMLAAMLCFSLYGVFSKKANSKYTPTLVTSYAFLFGLILITPLMLREGILLESLSYSVEAWGSVIFMSVFCSVVAYVIQQKSIKRLGVNKTMLFFNLVPLFAILFSFIFLGDPITPVNIVSAGIIVTAVVMNSRE